MSWYEPFWLKNAKLWTEPGMNRDHLWRYFTHNGLIQAVGYIPPQLLSHPDLQVEDAKVHGSLLV